MASVWNPSTWEEEVSRFRSSKLSSAEGSEFRAISKVPQTLFQKSKSPSQRKLRGRKGGSEGRDGRGSISERKIHKI